MTNDTDGKNLERQISTIECSFLEADPTNEQMNIELLVDFGSKNASATDQSLNSFCPNLLKLWREYLRLKARKNDRPTWCGAMLLW